MMAGDPPATAAAAAAAPLGGTLFGTVDFGEDKAAVRRLLEQKIPAEYLSTRVGAGKARFTYVESWRAIEIANSIFGFDGWSSSVVDITPDFVEEGPGGRFKVGVTAIVRVTLQNGSFHEDVGFGMSENRCKGSAIENAKKEAVSDARKRALRVYGNALGNSVYDRDYIESVRVPLAGQRKPPAAPVGYDHARRALASSSAATMMMVHPPAPAAAKAATVKTEPQQRPAGPTATAAAAAEGDFFADDFAIDTALLDQLHQLDEAPSAAGSDPATSSEPPNKRGRASC